MIPFLWLLPNSLETDMPLAWSPPTEVSKCAPKKFRTTDLGGDPRVLRLSFDDFLAEKRIGAFVKVSLLSESAWVRFQKVPIQAAQCESHVGTTSSQKRPGPGWRPVVSLEIRVMCKR